MLFVNNDTLYPIAHWAREHVWPILCGLIGLGIFVNVLYLFSNPFTQAPFTTLGEDKLLGPAYQMHTHIILNAPYFGIYTSNLNEDITPSHLTEVIVGIMFSETPALSQVVLRAEDGFDKVYRIGESVKSGVVIHAIHPDGIVVLNHGKLERLSLPEHRLKFESPSSPLKLGE